MPNVMANGSAENNRERDEDQLAPNAPQSPEIADLGAVRTIQNSANNQPAKAPIRNAPV